MKDGDPLWRRLPVLQELHRQWWIARGERLGQAQRPFSRHWDQLLADAGLISAEQRGEAERDALCGEYRDFGSHTVAIFFRQGDQFYEKNPQGEIVELAAESPTIFFYPNGSSLPRLTFERDAAGRISAVFRDDRHEERWEKRILVSSR